MLRVTRRVRWDGRWTLQLKSDAAEEGSTMARHRAGYAPEFRWQMVELARAGRSPEVLPRELEPSEGASGQSATATSAGELLPARTSGMIDRNQVSFNQPDAAKQGLI